jgi:hypothetical protein
MIYVIICGAYEDAHNEFVTTDINQAMEFAVSRRYYKGMPKESEPHWYDSLSDIEVWKDGKLVCDYYPDSGVCIKEFRKYLSPEELKLCLIKKIKESEEEV